MAGKAVALWSLRFGDAMAGRGRFIPKGSMGAKRHTAMDAQSPCSLWGRPLTAATPAPSVSPTLRHSYARPQIRFRFRSGVSAAWLRRGFATASLVRRGGSCSRQGIPYTCAHCVRRTYVRRPRPPFPLHGSRTARLHLSWVSTKKRLHFGFVAPDHRTTQFFADTPCDRWSRGIYSLRS